MFYQQHLNPVVLNNIWHLVALFSFYRSNPHRIYSVYNSVGYNCFIAAGIYVLVGAFSYCQMKLNKRKVGEQSDVWVVDCHIH